VSAPSLRPGLAPREQAETSFARILSGLVARVPGARAAALVDREGETVDYAGAGEPDEIRIAAAHWRIVLRDVQDQKSLAGAASLAIQAARRSFMVQSLPEGYAVVLLLGDELGTLRFERAMAACGTALAREAGWAIAHSPRWYPVDVTRDSSGRPLALELAGTSAALELLGRCADRVDFHDANAGGGASPASEPPGAHRASSSARERAWRVRLPFGAEAMLVCDPAGFWYTDEPLEDLAARSLQSSTNPRPKSRLEKDLQQTR
jgi:hypothetical protein